MANGRRGFLGILRGREEAPNVRIEPEQLPAVVDDVPQGNLPEVRLNAGQDIEAPTPDIGGALSRIALGRRGFMEGVRGALAAARLGSRAGTLARLVPEAPQERPEELDEIMRLFRNSYESPHIGTLDDAITGVLSGSNRARTANRNELEYLAHSYGRSNRNMYEFSLNRDRGHLEPYLREQPGAYGRVIDAVDPTSYSLRYTDEDVQTRISQLMNHAKFERLRNALRRSESPEDNDLVEFMDSINNPTNYGYMSEASVVDPVARYFRRNPEARGEDLDASINQYIETMVTRMAAKTGFSPEQIEHWIQESARRNNIGDHYWGNPEAHIAGDPDWLLGRYLVNKYGDLSHPEDIEFRNEMLRAQGVPEGGFWRPDPPEPEGGLGPTRNNDEHLYRR